MKELVWLESAVNDLVRLRSFLAQENSAAANRAAAIIKGSVQHLIHHPHVGKPVIDLPEYRDLFMRFGAGGYVLRYRIHEDVLYVVHIRHYREHDFTP